MTFRARLSLTALEARENPSVPTVDPFGGTAPPPADPSTVVLPPLPTPTDPAAVAEAAAIAGATLTPAPIDPLLGNNSVYKIPLLP